THAHAHHPRLQLRPPRPERLGRRDQDRLVRPFLLPGRHPKGHRVVLDPHGMKKYKTEPLEADLVLMSHFGEHHTRLLGVVENLKAAKQHNALKKVRTDKGLVEDWNEVKGKAGDLEFFSVPTYRDEHRGEKRGKNGCWVMDVGGVRIAHLGELGHKL